MKKYIGVDIGGMSIKIGLVNEEGNLLAKTVVKTESDAESVFMSGRTNRRLRTCMCQGSPE